MRNISPKLSYFKAFTHTPLRSTVQTQSMASPVAPERVKDTDLVYDVCYCKGQLSRKYANTV